MKDSYIKDIDGETFPDPLSLNFNDLKLTTAPYKKRLEARHAVRPWLVMYEMFNITEQDDILLTMNGASWKSLLDPGDEIYIPTQEDISSFITRMKLKNGSL